MEIQKTLFSLAESQYRDFSASLIPTVVKETVIGVRVPQLRRIAKSFEEKDAFLRSLPHEYHEENMLHALLIADIKEPSQCIEAIKAFLPFIDNWAVCDALRPKYLGKNCQLLLDHINKWLKSDHTYTVRFGIEMLMLYFPFESQYLNMVASVRSNEYYVKMMMAWYFATALTVRYENALPYIEEKRLSPWIHNKSIQKAIESLQIPKERKEYLKSLRRGRKENI